MKNQLLTLGAAIALSAASTAWAAPVRPTLQERASAASSRMQPNQRHWRHNALQAPSSKGMKAAPQPDRTVGPMSYWGSLATPSGEEWMYSCEYVYSQVPTEWGGSIETIASAVVTIYDGNYKEYKTFTAEFELGEHETSINTVQVSPTLSRKFFNINDAYEVMVYVHATTDDYTGHEYTQVYTLSDGSLVDTIEGNNVACINTATDSWSESFNMVFMREEVSMTEDSYGYHVLFDVYSKAGWGGGSKLEHTFDIDYQYISGAGDYALPILVSKYNNQPYYVLPSYEKPYFVSEMSDDITPDNHFLIDLYDSHFNLVRTTSIPMELEGEALFSFPGMGLLNGFGDVSFDSYGEPVYVVGVENYMPANDDFITSTYVYNAAGERQTTLFENAYDYLPMSAVRGYEQQYCVYYPADDGGYFSFVDVPSGEERAVIPVVLGDSFISTSLDRVGTGDSYQYISSLTTGLVDDQDNVIHRFAWYNADGEFDRYDAINLGPDVVMALPYIDGAALDPYLFDTSDNREYMILVKEYVGDGTSRSRECLRIYNDASELIFSLGPNEETREYLSSIYLSNLNTSDPKLVATYTTPDYEYNLNAYSLPLVKFTMGEGTADNPYLISSAGEMHAMQHAPGAYYELVDDIDFRGISWTGNKCEFTGHIMGNGHTLRNLCLEGHGLFTSLSNGATISDLNIDGVTMAASGQSGIIAGVVSGGDASGCKIDNVHISNATVTSAGDMDFGGIAGDLNLQSTITNSSVTRASITGDRYSYAGGIAGRISTGAVLANCHFDGEISAETAGGIVAESSLGDESVTNCHVHATVSASNVAGGVIGYSSRSTVAHCYVEGAVSANGGRQAYAGGIVGSLKANYTDEHPVILKHNISAAAVSAQGAEAIAHRIAGFTSGDEMLVDWESDDPSVDWGDPSTYPYVPGDPEVSMSGNYALGTERVDKTVADDTGSAEGKSVSAGEITDQWLSAALWEMGSTSAAPWRRGGSLLALYYESFAIKADKSHLELGAEDAPSATVAFTCDSRYAHLITVASSDESVAGIISRSVSSDGYTVVCEISLTGLGECTVTASLGDETAECRVSAKPASLADISTESSAITYDGLTLRADGDIEVYTPAGMLVARGHGSLGTGSLAKGVYIAVSADSILKFRK